MSKWSFLLGTVLLLSSCDTAVPPVAIVPQPQQVTTTEDIFVITPSTSLGASGDALGVASLFQERFTTVSGHRLPLSETGSIHFTVDSTLSLDPEGYTLDIDARQVQLQASTEAGLFYGLMTLYQLLPVDIYGDAVVTTPWLLPGVHIIDAPRYRWRGLHLDVARHMMPVWFIRDYLDWMAIHKLNRFHWHLTDDQGWRIEIPAYPQLTTVGATRSETLLGPFFQPEPKQFDGTPHGGFYTQKEIREIVAYAAARHIMVIPEISMPGHASAAIASYPMLSRDGSTTAVGTTWGTYTDSFNSSEATFAFLETVLTDVATLFPGPYIHLGGDETRLDPQVYRAFMGRSAQIVTDLGKIPLGWDEAQNALPSSGLITSRLPEQYDGTLPLILTPQDALFFDYAEERDASLPVSFTTSDPLHVAVSLFDTYSYEAPVLDVPIEGVQGQVWTEYMPRPEDVITMLFPRIAGLAELAWSSDRNWEDFQRRLHTQGDRYRALGFVLQKLTP